MLTLLLVVVRLRLRVLLAGLEGGVWRASVLRLVVAGSRIWVHVLLLLLLLLSCRLSLILRLLPRCAALV